MGFLSRVAEIAGDLVDNLLDPLPGEEGAHLAITKTFLTQVIPGPTSQRILLIEEANRPCTDFTPPELLELLNRYAGKKRKMDYKELLEPTLEQVCNGSIATDVGTIYSWFRLDAMGSRLDTPFDEIFDFDFGINCSRPSITTSKENGLRVIEASPRNLCPARIWDLYSNRVIPFSWFSRRQVVGKLFGDAFGKRPFVAISHSWTADMVENMKTPVNHYHYPVPLPQGIDLEDIRDTLFRTSTYQFCWVDVLCIRQKYCTKDKKPLPGWEDKHSEGEEWRRKEWVTDIPLLGAIYEQALEILRYYNGLGRPFKTEGWECEKHWRNRVWTLQETSCLATNHHGSFSRGEPFSMDIMCKDGQNYKTAGELLEGSDIRRLPRTSRVLNSDMSCEYSYPEEIPTWEAFQAIVREVYRRQCKDRWARFVVLAYLCRCDPIPIYDEGLGEDEEAMFRVIWECLHYKLKKIIRLEMNCTYGAAPTWEAIRALLGAHPQQWVECPCADCARIRRRK